MNEIATRMRPSQALPAVAPEEASHREIASFMQVTEVYWRWKYMNVWPLASELPDRAMVQSMVSSVGTLIAARSRPATQNEVIAHLAVMLACMTGNKVDNDVFGRTLQADVGAQQPTIGAVEAACRTLRRKETFLPSIAEVLKAIADEEALLRSAKLRLEVLPELLIAHDRFQEDRRRDQLNGIIRDRVRFGENSGSLDGFTTAEIAEACRIMKIDPKSVDARFDEDAGSAEVA